MKDRVGRGAWGKYRERESERERGGRGETEEARES